MQYAPDAAFVDISHRVAPYDLQQEAYLLLSAYKHFPQGSVHLLLVDVFGGEVPRMLLAEKEGYFFIAPDNGLLPLAFGKELENTRLCLECNKPYLFSKWINIAGEIIQALRQNPGKLALKQYEIKEMRRLLQPQIVPFGIDSNVLYIDRYENVVLNITKSQFEEIVKDKPFKIKIMRMQDISTISNNYYDVPDGAPLCRFNDAGFLEIALNHAPAASLLGLSHGNGGNVRYQTVRIFY